MDVFTSRMERNGRKQVFRIFWGLLMQIQESIFDRQNPVL